MHMFRIAFCANHANGLVETGKVVVMAESHEQAFDVMCACMTLPPSRTRAIESLKLKPAIHLIESHQDHPNAKVSMRNNPNSQAVRLGPPPPKLRYHITVDATNVSGQSETQVIRKVAEELQARGTHTRLRHGLQMSIECDEVSEPERRTAGTMSRIEMYGARHSGRVNGGRTQGR